MSIAKTVLWEGKTRSKNLSHELTDKITNYDFIYVVHSLSDNIEIQSILEPSSMLSEESLIDSTYVSGNKKVFYVLSFKEKEFTIVNSNASSNNYITKILGYTVSGSDIDFNSKIDHINTKVAEQDTKIDDIITKIGNVGDVDLQSQIDELKKSGGGGSNTFKVSATQIPSQATQINTVNKTTYTEVNTDEDS